MGENFYQEGTTLKDMCPFSTWFLTRWFFSFNTSQGCRAIPGLGPIEGDHWLKRIERRSAIIRFGEHRTIPVRLVAAQPGLYF
ncbi:hypothetical protein CPSG_02171 [Coccidioides posadasii str. Silveira]|uniref:Uncharacterized protein n=2 Tax=Coccidioides posadasii TaxID=199306 RepID=E9CUW2_COCPS|nr:hypothetical protein CPSG_02171 [Coccidioides posadasii str. Silveira]KMM65479.1 hypothetical protein CPAG_01830 [Coccidioides posadasii RMSCC 3488]